MSSFILKYFLQNRSGQPSKTIEAEGGKEKA
jgi:hypothetical protein